MIFLIIITYIFNMILIIIYVITIASVVKSMYVCIGPVEHWLDPLCPGVGVVFVIIIIISCIIIITSCIVIVIFSCIIIIITSCIFIIIITSILTVSPLFHCITCMLHLGHREERRVPKPHSPSWGRVHHEMK